MVVLQICSLLRSRLAQKKKIQVLDFVNTWTMGAMEKLKKQLVSNIILKQMTYYKHWRKMESWESEP
jgi:hypothetical protein